jgi:hypothetical protein
MYATTSLCYLDLLPLVLTRAVALLSEPGTGSIPVGTKISVRGIGHSKGLDLRSKLTAVRSLCCNREVTRV